MKAIAKIWKTFRPIKETDTEQEREEKEFYNSILSDRKPYFFKYLYKDCKTTYNKAYNSFDKESRRRYKITLKELMSIENKTEEQEKLINHFVAETRLIMSDCEMNRLCKHIENTNFEIKLNVRDDSKFDYMYFFDEDIEWNQEIYEKVFELMQMFSLSKKSNKLANSLRENQKIGVKSDNEVTNGKKLEIEVMRNRLLEEGTSDSRELCNYLLKIFYEDKRSWDKGLLWKLVGDILYERCFNKSNGNIRVPVLDNDGDIVFYNDRFSIRDVNISKDEDVNPC